MRRIASLWRDQSGGVAVMAAGGALVACLIAAAAIDGGAVVLHARRLQTAADLAALSAARDLPHARAAAEATARSNLPDLSDARVATGLYLPDPALPPHRRFREDTGGLAPNAARVTLSSSVQLRFGGVFLGRPSTTVTREARAAATAAPPMAVFSIGSRLARLDGGIANQVLGAPAGGQVSLSLMDYRALADADVSLLQFSDALATEAGVRLGDYDRLAETEVEAGEALAALAAASDGADAALTQLSRAAQGRRLRVGDLMQMETGAREALRDGLDARLSALDVAAAALEVASGDRQVALDLGARTGLADVDAWLAIGERPNRSPWLTVTKQGQPVVRTAQARLYLRARTANALGALGQVEAPILVELAASEARLEDIRCAPRRVDLGVRPGVARAWIGRIDPARLSDFKSAPQVSPARLVDVAGLAVVTGRAEIEAADQSFTRVAFDDRAIVEADARTVSSRGFASGLVASLFARLELEARVAGLGLGAGALAEAVGRLLTPLGPVLDQIVNAVLDPLGLSFGQADVTVHGASCPDRPPTPVLVG